MQFYSNSNVFESTFSPAELDNYIMQGRENMVTTDNAPTLTIASYSFGATSVRAIISAHLTSLILAYGIHGTTPVEVDIIASDIMSGFPHLKITEIMLALKMMREGKFREGRDGSSNRGEMYGSLSSSVICDCINRFCIEYRNPVLEKAENEEKLRRLKEEQTNAASDGDKLNIIGGAIIENPSTILFYQSFLTPKQMATLEYYAKERKALILLKQRVEEYLKTPADSRSVESLSKGIEYINSNFPYDPQSIDISK